MIEQHNNSVIYRDVDLDSLEDLTLMGAVNRKGQTLTITEPDHYFIAGDAIYYNFNTRHYNRALAVNTIMSEVIGVVNKVIDKNNFELTLKGNIILDRYNDIQEGSLLYLSSVVSGKLIDIEPFNISKIIGTKTKNGIEIDIQRGYSLVQDEGITDFIDFRYYTQQEIQDIITNIKRDIYE